MNIHNLKQAYQLQSDIETLEELRSDVIDEGSLAVHIPLINRHIDNPAFIEALRKAVLHHLAKAIEHRKSELRNLGVDVPKAKPTPDVFVSYEIKPCVLWEGDVRSYQTNKLATQAIEDLYFGYVGVGDSRPEVFWTLYGRDVQGLGCAIGDFAFERNAREVAYAITRNHKWLEPDTGLATNISEAS